MPDTITGAKIACDTYPELTTPPDSLHTTWPGIDAYTDTLTTSVDAPVDSWVMCLVMGGYVLVPSALSTWPLPPPLKPDVTFETFEALEHDNFRFDIPPNGINQTNTYAAFLSTNDAATPNIYTTYVTEEYPPLSVSAPGSLTAQISSGASLLISWPHADAVVRRAYAVFAIYIQGPFDPALSGGVPNGAPIGIDATIPSSTPIINDGTDSPTVTSYGSSGADPGHGGLTIIGLAWDDTAILPTLPDGWTDLGHCADDTTGWAGMIVGRVFDAGDTGPYAFTATFASSVKSSACLDTYQTPAKGLHIWQTI